MRTGGLPNGGNNGVIVGRDRGSDVVLPDARVLAANCHTKNSITMPMKLKRYVINQRNLARCSETVLTRDMTLAGIAAALGLVFALVLGILAVTGVMNVQTSGVTIGNGIGPWFGTLVPVLYGILAFIGLGTVIAILAAVFRR